MPPLSRKSKLITALEHFEGKEKTAKEILKWMSERWAKTGFKGPKSLGLYLRRYRFLKEGSVYKIEQEKINNRKELGDDEW